MKIQTLIFLIFLSLPVMIGAQTCTEGDCLNGQGAIIYPDGSKYVGFFKDGKLNGRGIHSYPDGTIYEGEFENGKLQGQGKQIYPTGTIYVGEFKDNVPNGQGIRTSPDGRKYEGSFKSGKPDGRGKTVFPSGGGYEGDFKNGVPNGQGTMTYPTGGAYTGAMKDGRANGKGTRTFPEGYAYTGEFGNDRPNGWGVMVFPNGGKYEGEFRDGAQEGQGTYTLANGRRYKGEFKKNRPNGQGTETFPDGKSYTGEFKDGLSDGHGTMTYPDGSVLSGEFALGKGEGKGQLAFSNGSKYVGDIKGNKPNGQGTMTLADGKAYSGEFKDGSFTGQGTLIDPDGTKHVVDFKGMTTLFDKAYDLAKSGKHVESLPCYEEATKLVPQFGDTWQEYCVALRRTNHLQQAARACWKTIEVDEKKPGGWHNIVNVFMQSKDWGAAYDACLRLDGAASDKASVENQCINVGYYAWLDGNYSIAEKALEFVLARNKTNIKALIDYGALKASKGQVAEGRKNIDFALRNTHDMQALEYGTALLHEIDQTGMVKPRRGHFSESFQFLPERFVKRPAKGEALGLRIDDYVTKIFPAPFGKLKMTVPEAWHETLRPKDANTANINIMLHPDDKAKFSVLITAFADKRNIPGGSAGDVKVLAEIAASRAQSSAVENPIEIKELNSPTVHGYYFFMTDKNLLGKEPNAYDYLYMYQGAFQVKSVTIIVSAFAWDLNEKNKKDILSLFSSFDLEVP